MIATTHRQRCSDIVDAIVRCGLHLSPPRPLRYAASIPTARKSGQARETHLAWTNLQPGEFARYWDLVTAIRGHKTALGVTWPELERRHGLTRLSQRVTAPPRGTRETEALSYLETVASKIGVRV